MKGFLRKMLIYVSIVSAVAVFFFNNASSKELVCGIATGFPPYQFQENEQVTGFDSEVIRLVVSGTQMIREGEIEKLRNKWF